MVDEIKKEVDDLLDGFFPGEKEPSNDDPPPSGEPPKGDEPPKEEPPKEEPPVEEPPKEEPPKEEPPKEEPPKEEPLKEEPPKEEPPEEEPPPEETSEEELTRLRSQNELLLGRLEKGYEPPPETPPKEEKPPGEEPPKETPPVEVKPPEPIDFVEGKSLEEILDTREGLNKFLNEVVGKIVPKGSAVDVEPVVERILTALPKIVQAQVTQQTAVNELVADFYKANKDLLVARRTVGIFTNEVHSEHPDWTTKKVFEEAGDRTRKALGLKEKAKGAERSKPAFVRTRGTRKGGELDKRTGLAKDIDELID